MLYNIPVLCCSENISLHITMSVLCTCSVGWPVALTTFISLWAASHCTKYVSIMAFAQNLLAVMVNDMVQDYATLGYSAEGASSVMDVLVPISSEGRTLGSELQVGDDIRSRLPTFHYIRNLRSVGSVSCMLTSSNHLPSSGAQFPPNVHGTRKQGDSPEQTANNLLFYSARSSANRPFEKLRSVYALR